MDLFDFDKPTGHDKLGFRLYKLEVYNWGTFHRKVWQLELNGDTSLLTGDVGSGKSTLVDALITLLVPPRRVTYNKAADSSAKERSLLSYVRGYYGQKRTSEGLGKPEALRNTDEYSVILATFQDTNLGEAVTLAQVFWFADETGTPRRFYVVGAKNLLIKEHFADFGTDIRQLKRRLDKDMYIKTYDDYASYSRDFRRRFGIKQEQALNLFQQTISMKQVDALTGFVRSNMLAEPETEIEVQSLLNHFYDLDMAHEAVKRAKRQQELLQPLAEIGCRYLEGRQWQAKLKGMTAAVPAWFAEQANQQLSALIARRQGQLDEKGRELAETRQQLAKVKKDVSSLNLAIAQSGGQRLDTLKLELRHLEENYQRSKAEYDEYTEAAQFLDIAAPLDEGTFLANQTVFKERICLAGVKLGELAEDLKSCQFNQRDLKDEKARLAKEIESLKNRKSSIPREYVEIRSRLCQSMDLAESEIPFAGELMEVKTEESAWEGAIERLLHSFGLSLLVPEAHYGEVVDFMERARLNVRLVYYKVSNRDSGDVRPLREGAVYEKLNLRHDTEFTDWLERELRQRFNHVCCDNMSDFRQSDFALSKSGQVKTGGRRHEKDDRHMIDDRRQYILGFSNQRKLELLEQEVKDLNSEIQRWGRRIKEITAWQEETRKQLTLLENLIKYTDFSRLDIFRQQCDIDAKAAEIKALDAESDKLRLLREQYYEAKRRHDKLDKLLLELSNDITRLETLQGQDFVRIQANDAVLGQIERVAYEKQAVLLEEFKTEALGGKVVDGADLKSGESRYLAWLDRARDDNDRLLDELQATLIRHMSDFQHEFPQESRDMDASPDALPEYERLLIQLEVDGLPRFEEKFRELLKENTIKHITLFYNKLENKCDEIRERIDMINNSLNTIDYNEGRYIRIEYEQTADSEIKEFRMQLKACIDNALSDDDEQYNEAKFKNVKAIVERFRGREGFFDIDMSWKNKVIDVRNWYRFAASEIWRANDEEYEHYTDSGGKSGGQKEKLAYTILAASLVYNFGLEAKEKRIQSFRFVVIDEAFLKSSDEAARFGMELFKKLQLQLLVVTPLLKIATIEPYVTHIGFVSQNDEIHHSYLRNLTVQEMKAEQARAIK